MEKVILTVKEMAKYLNCSESCIRKLKQESKIPYFRVATKILFDKNIIDNWIYQNQIISIDCKNNNLDVKIYE